MPGASAQMAYFFSKLPALRSDQKAAAVNLGIFPSEGARVAGSGPVMQPYAGAAPGDDRIGSIEQWLAQTSRPAAPAPAAQAPATQTAAVALPSRPPGPPNQAQAASARERIWLQLASGPNADALPEQFRRIRSRNRDLFDGISPYVAQDGVRARLLIGPFRSEKDAGIFAEDLEAVRISAFQWTSKPGQDVRKLPGE